jgi:hypothetical protein
MTNPIYAPNIYLFAYHLCEHNQDDLEPNVNYNYDQNLLWQKCNQVIFPRFKVAQNLDILNELSGARVELLRGKNFKNSALNFRGETEYHHTPIEINGYVQPLRIQDTYALSLNLSYPHDDQNYAKIDSLDLSILGSFNPSNCLLPQSINSSLGQTILITAWAKENVNNDREFLRDLADKSVKSFLGDLPASQIPLRRQEGQLFGSHIFEYGLLSQEDDYCHIIVWLFSQGRTDEKLNKCYQQIIDLFLYYNKVIQSYKRSRNLYETEVKFAYENMEKQIDRIESFPVEKSMTRQQLNELKLQLKTLPKKALEYAKWQRYLEQQNFIITLNTRNYAEKVRQIKNKLPNETLSFLETFNRKNCPYFQEQIHSYLGYCQHGLSLVDKMIASIRGIVEIDQAEKYCSD